MSCRYARIGVDFITEKKSKGLEIQEGIVIAIAFLIFGGFIYLNPSYIGHIKTSYVSASILLVIGVIGLGIELSKIGNQKTRILGLDDLGIGIGVGILWLTIYSLLDLWFINIPNSFFLFTSIYFILNGIINIFKNLLSSTNKKVFLLKLIIFIVQVIGFISAIITIISIFNI